MLACLYPVVTEADLAAGRAARPRGEGDAGEGGTPASARSGCWMGGGRGCGGSGDAAGPAGPRTCCSRPGARRGVLRH